MTLIIVKFLHKIGAIGEYVILNQCQLLHLEYLRDQYCLLGR